MSALSGSSEAPSLAAQGEAGLEPKTPYPQTITAQSLLAIDEMDLLFGTDKLLPLVEDIPEDFIRGNVYTSAVENLFSESFPPHLKLQYREGFDPKLAARAVQAHLQSWSPKHQHKIAGVGYLLSLMATVSDSGQSDSGAGETNTI